MRVNGTLYYTLKDHLGSASVVTDTSGNVVGESRYYTFGETRLATGSMFTDKLYTSQREMTGLGIYHYGARFYSPKLGRFLSPDTIVPNFANPQDLNRFSYVRNNPIRYTDPSGHACVEGTSYCYDPRTGRRSGSLTSYNDICTGNCGGPAKLPTKPQGGSGGNPSPEQYDGEDDLETTLSIVAGAPDIYTASLSYTNVNANGNLSLGASPLFQETYGLRPGGNYLPSTIGRAVGQNLIQGSSSYSSGLITGLVSLTTNLYSYTYGDRAGNPIGQEFAVSVGVDTVLGIAAGIAAATMVTVAVTAGAIVASPLAIVGLTIGLGLAIGIGLDWVQAPDMIKGDVNWAIDSLQGQP